MVDLADEIAYNCHDVDDGLWSGVIHLEDLLEIDVFNELYEKSVNDQPNLSHSKRQYHIIRLMINREVTDLIQTTAGNLEKSKIKTLADVRNNPGENVQFLV